MQGWQFVRFFNLFGSLHSVLEIVRDLDPLLWTRCPYSATFSSRVRSVVANVRDEFANRIDSRFISGVGRRSRDNVTQPREFTEFAVENCLSLSWIEFYSIYAYVFHIIFHLVATLLLYIYYYMYINIIHTFVQVRQHHEFKRSTTLLQRYIIFFLSENMYHEIQSW